MRKPFKKFHKINIFIGVFDNGTERDFKNSWDIVYIPDDDDDAAHGRCSIHVFSQFAQSRIYKCLVSCVFYWNKKNKIKIKYKLYNCIYAVWFCVFYFFSQERNTYLYLKNKIKQQNTNRFYIISIFHMPFSFLHMLPYLNFVLSFLHLILVFFNVITDKIAFYSHLLYFYLYILLGFFLDLFLFFCKLLKELIIFARPHLSTSIIMTIFSRWVHTWVSYRVNS